MIYHSVAATPANTGTSNKLTTSYVTQADLTAAIQQAIGTLPGSTSLTTGSPTSPNVQAQLDALQRQISLTNQINNLAPTNNVALSISNPTITGGTISNATLQGNTLNAGVSTLGATTIAGGLTLTGGATFAGNVGIGTTTPSAKLFRNVDRQRITRHHFTHHKRRHSTPGAQLINVGPHAVCMSASYSKIFKK